MAKEGFAVFMVALIKLLIQSYGKLIQDVLLSICCYARQCLDTAEGLLEHKVRGGACVGADGMASSSSSRLLGVVPRGKHGGDCTIGSEFPFSACNFAQ